MTESLKIKKKVQLNIILNNLLAHRWSTKFKSVISSTRIIAEQE